MNGKPQQPMLQPAPQEQYDFYNSYRHYFCVKTFYTGLLHNGINTYPSSQSSDDEERKDAENDFVSYANHLVRSHSDHLSTTAM